MEVDINRIAITVKEDVSIVMDTEREISIPLSTLDTEVFVMANEDVLCHTELIEGFFSLNMHIIEVNITSDITHNKIVVVVG
jgi:hypothetical protein